LWQTFAHIAVTTPGYEEPARRSLQNLAGVAGGAPLAVVEAVRMRQRGGGPEAAWRWLREQSIDLSDPTNEAALEAFVDLALSLDRAKEALKVVDAAIAAHPEAPGAHALRGRVLAETDSSEIAAEAFDRALALKPEHPGALTGLARLAAQSGDRARAVALYERAAKSDPDNPQPAWAAYQLLAEAKQESPSERAARLERHLLAHPRHAPAALALAELRDASGDHDQALGLARRAVAFLAGPPAVEMVARIQLETGDAKAALETLGHMTPENLARPSAQYWLGIARARTGDTSGAREALGRALAVGEEPYSTRASEELARSAWMRANNFVVQVNDARCRRRMTQAHEVEQP
jgi:tetratricopeptide (TPR) repeat protein